MVFPDMTVKEGTFENNVFIEPPTEVVIEKKLSHSISFKIILLTKKTKIITHKGTLNFHQEQQASIT